MLPPSSTPITPLAYKGFPTVYCSDIAVIAKIESIDSLKNLEEIILASDGAMVARGDLGAQIPLEQVPSAQQKIVQLCRQLNKPVIVASQLLESMIEYPTPTRAEVADVSEAVRQRADALMLSGESAMGQFPDKALTVLRSVSLRIEKWWREEKRHEAMELPDVGSSFAESISEEICNSAAKMGKYMLPLYSIAGLRKFEVSLFWLMLLSEAPFVVDTLVLSQLLTWIIL